MNFLAGQEGEQPGGWLDLLDPYPCGGTVTPAPNTLIFFLWTVLMCRGKAMQDFKGPDCRFVNFKKGEAVYVYYKLIGKSTELWAGSVGRDFGYFPKDLLEINHNYSNEELELPTDETDFVCFDGGRDDFDNYNVDELLKSLQETISNEEETESSDPGTKPAEGIERDEEIGQVDTVKSPDALETDNLEMTSTRDVKEALSMTEEVDSSLTEGTENTGGDSSVSSHKENSQGDQIAHEHLKGMLHGKLKGLESENTKNTSIPQGETSQLDTENEEVNAYTLLNRELSMNLKTKFGSTADAVVSDDEVTRLVTSLEDDFNEDLSVNAHDADEEPDFADQSEEIPLLSFMAEDKITSPADLEDDENDDIDSQNYELDEDAEGATDKSDKSADSISVDRSKSKQIEEKQDEVMLISKREAPATTQPEDLSKEPLRKEPVGTGGLDSKEKTNKTEQFKEQLPADGTESLTEELKSTTAPDPHVLPSPGGNLESKSFVKSKQDALKPSLGDINQSPERAPLSQIEKDEKNFEDDTLEEVLESDLKHKKLWEKPKEKGRAENKPSVDVPAKPVEEAKNASQSDLGDTDLLKEKLERGMPTYSEADMIEELSRNLGKMTDADSDRNLGTNLAKGRTLRSELQSEEPDAEDDPDLKQIEEELLEDENAASAQLSQARAANVQGDTPNVRSKNPELGKAVLRTGNPTFKAGEETNSFSKETKKTITMQDASKTGNKEVDVPVSEDAKLDEMEHVTEDYESSEAEEPSAVAEHSFQSPDTEDSNDFTQRKDHFPEGISQKDSEDVQNLEHVRNDHQQSAHLPSPADSSAATSDTVTDFSESVKRLTIMRDFLDEKRVIRLQKYLGLQHMFRLEAMFHDMKVEMELARKASHNNEDIEKALDLILEFSESSIMDVVGKILDSKVAENKEEVVKEMDLYDEESALMDDIQELMYSLRSKYSSAGESVPLASFPEQEDDQLHVQGRMLNQLIKTLSQTTLSEMQASSCFVVFFVFSLQKNCKKALDGSLIFERNKSIWQAAYCAPVFNENIFIVVNAVGFQLVATLPEEMRPGPDFHGLPWEPVIITALVGIATLAIIFWRTCLSVKSRIYQVTEKQLAEKIKNLLQEKTEILEKMSEYDQKIKEAKESVKVAQEQKDILSDETAGLKDTVKGLEEANRQLDDKVKNLHTMLETERKKNDKKQNKISETQKSLEKLQEAISVHSVELSEVQIALNEAKLNEEKVKSELHHVQEENARLKKSKEQLLKEAEGWSERHTELSEQIKLYQKSQKDIEEALAYKENEIEKQGKQIYFSLLDNESEKMKTQIKQMMDVSRVKTMLSIVEEDRNLLQSKLSDEVTARHELEEQIKKLEHDSCSLQSAKARLENECKTLQQKVEILGELYQQKEMALQKKLTQEEYERQEKEQKLSAADEKAVLAIEEVKVYKQRIQDMEEELQKTERSYKNQIAAHEKKAHDNWLIARSAERALAEEKREAANLRQKLIEVNQKIVMLQRPLIVKPTPGRPDRQVPPRRGPLSRDGSFGPSPVSGGNPSPTQMIEVPARPLSAPRREGSRSEFGTVVDGPPVPRRPPELPGRMSVPGKLYGLHPTAAYSDILSVQKFSSVPYPKHGKTYVCGSFYRSWACCSIPDQ
uniref:Transport and Golgi organization protein 1 homolog n=2 Tax=Strigidae TaxID=30459 RepID=A0A663M2I1_ATHCN